MSIKLIALDLDGTTLNDNHVTMTKANRLAILEAMARGIIVVPTTGRTFFDLPRCVRRLSDISYVITSNGASVIDFKREKETYKNWMDAETATAVLKILQTSQVYAEVYYEKMAYAEQHSYAKLERRVKSWPVLYFYARRRKVNRLSDFIEKVGKPIEKIEIMPGILKKEKILEELNFLPITISTSGMNSIEITNQDADKADGLAHLCRYLKIDAQDVMAIGDNGNDLAMLKWAGVSVAVANAEKEIIRTVDFVTDKSNASGVAKAIRYLAFGDKTDGGFVHCNGKIK